MKVVVLEEQFESLSRGMNINKDFFTRSIRIDLEESDFDKWLHTYGIRATQQIQNWATQKVLMSGGEVVGKYWDSILEYETIKNFNYF